ncbi:glutathione S-transferase [Pseudoxanthomonas winnipegensis]|uniref:glutathione transferase n=1 Tax=Pseudoxanthomonas winnipegensis TaxID=2480810 RepID=A0A4Q8L8V9_9GAMM|nr:glutathione S-transferase [Pseudoxanthomonas winnipegensis]TAA24391.1 glutathione S-transferase [Pseudoxanthomonas winnipegensis]
MITVHHLNNSRSQRVLWLLEELGLDYTVMRYQRDPRTMLAPPELKKIHPLGKSPLVEDEGRLLAESGAIIEYLVERYDVARTFAPTPGSDAHLRYRYWLHYAEGSLMPPLLVTLVLGRIRSAPMPFFARPIARGIADKVMAGFARPQIKLHLDYLEGELGRHAWFAGEDFSAADVQMSFPLEAAQARYGFDGHPLLARFIQRIHARAAYQRALEQGGPYDLLS